MWRKVCFLLLFACPNLLWGQADTKIPKGFEVPADTLSPDKRLGFLVPDIDNDSRDARNSLVDVKTGRVLAILQAASVGYSRMNQGGVLPTRWSPDGSVAIWQVDGKWSDEALVALRLQAGKVAWQANVLKLGEQAILNRTKQAAPKEYAKVQKMNGGMGTLPPGELAGVDDPRSSYPQGFSIQVDVTGPLTFPLHVTAELTSGAKPGVDMYNYLTSHLTGLLDEKGKLTVTEFHLGPAKPSRFSGE